MYLCIVQSANSKTVSGDGGRGEEERGRPLARLDPSPESGKQQEEVAIVLHIIMYITYRRETKTIQCYIIWYSPYLVVGRGWNISVRTFRRSPSARRRPRRPRWRTPAEELATCRHGASALLCAAVLRWPVCCGVAAATAFHVPFIAAVALSRAGRFFSLNALFSQRAGPPPLGWVNAMLYHATVDRRRHRRTTPCNIDGDSRRAIFSRERNLIRVWSQVREIARRALVLYINVGRTGNRYTRGIGIYNIRTEDGDYGRGGVIIRVFIDIYICVCVYILNTGSE